MQGPMVWHLAKIFVVKKKFGRAIEDGPPFFLGGGVCRARLECKLST